MPTPAKYDGRASGDGGVQTIRGLREDAGEGDEVTSMKDRRAVTAARGSSQRRVVVPDPDATGAKTASVGSDSSSYSEPCCGIRS